jgi:hypothetical protein
MRIKGDDTLKKKVICRKVLGYKDITVGDVYTIYSYTGDGMSLYYVILNDAGEFSKYPSFMFDILEESDYKVKIKCCKRRK